jgi:hypothetical protein
MLSALTEYPLMTMGVLTYATSGRSRPLHYFPELTGMACLWERVGRGHLKIRKIERRTLCGELQKKEF